MIRLSIYFGYALLSLLMFDLAGLGVDALGGGKVERDKILGPIPAEIERVVDGDTVKVRARIWLEQELHVSVRVANIDALELFRPKCDVEKDRAKRAKSYVESFFSDGILFLHEIESDKYAGRVVARLTNSSGEDLGDALIVNQHAVALQKKKQKDFGVLINVP